MKKLLALLAILAVPASLIHYIRILDKDLAKRFPHLTPKVRRKAYAEFLREARRTEEDWDDLTDEQMDVIYLEIVRRITT